MTEGWFERESDEEPLRTALQHYQLARTALFDLRTADARDQLNKATNLVPDLPEALAARSFLAGWFDDHISALKIVERATQVAPSYLKAWANYAGLLAWKHNTKDAEYAIRVCLKLCPNHSVTLETKGYVDWVRGKLDTAKTSLQLAVDAEPEAVSAKVLLARLLFATDDPDAALRELTAAKQIARTKYDQVMISRAYMEDFELPPEEVIQIAERTLAIHPGCAVSKYNILSSNPSLKEDDSERHEATRDSIPDLESLVAKLERSFLRDTVVRGLAAAELDCAFHSDKLARNSDSEETAAARRRDIQRHAAKASELLRETLANDRRWEHRDGLEFSLSQLVAALVLQNELQEARHRANELLVRAPESKSCEWVREQIEWIDSQLEGDD